MYAFSKNTDLSIKADANFLNGEANSLKGHSHLCDRADLDASVCQF